MNYKRIELDLTQERTNQAVKLGGSFKAFLIVKADSKFEYRINSQSADVLYSDELQGFEGDGVFHTLYVSNEVGTGKAVLVVY